MSGDKGSITGACLCGSVRYEISAPSIFTAICHCRNCQRQSGGAFSIVTAFPEAAYVQHGNTKVYKDSSNAGRKVERHFCSQCGSAIFSRIVPLPDTVLIKSGTLDNPVGIEPAVEVFCASKMAFLPSIPGTQIYAGSNI